MAFIVAFEGKNCNVYLAETRETRHKSDESWLSITASSDYRLQIARFAANCSSSVLPPIAVVDDCPDMIVFCTASK